MPFILMKKEHIFWLRQHTQLITGDYGGLKLPILYTDYMVLQRNTPLRIHGTANTKTPVTVSIDGQKKKPLLIKTVNGK